jgi:hypothetical protein
MVNYTVADVDDDGVAVIVVPGSLHIDSGRHRSIDGLVPLAPEGRASRRRATRPVEPQAARAGRGVLLRAPDTAVMPGVAACWVLVDCACGSAVEHGTPRPRWPGRSRLCGVLWRGAANEDAGRVAAVRHRPQRQEVGAVGV